VVGDLAYERGTYTIEVKDQATGAPVAEIHNRHIHIFKHQPDGRWQTWRMMTNSASAPSGPG
jgi:ketosteroid isomerase-like protein